MEISVIALSNAPNHGERRGEEMRRVDVDGTMEFRGSPVLAFLEEGTASCFVVIGNVREQVKNCPPPRRCSYY